mmetsp:Transcript_149096/g.478876  ORF Transcript_149096/g.478876 Transcript_149096/m.478876 type:complete len:389 (+) Transcript_149096:60-1226(+)
MSANGRDENGVAAGKPPVPPFFEGTEKRIEIDFAGSGDLRKIPYASWEEVIQLSKTQILNSKETEEFTSFLLSESSLIVYPSKVMLKTCGGTVPLNAVARIFELAASVGMEEEWLCYSRKNFLEPSAQPPEYASQESEISVCKKACAGIGESYLLGPMTGEHWLLYDAAFKDTDCSSRAEFHIDIMMYDLPADVRNHFFSAEPEGSRKGAEEMTKHSGLGALTEGMKAVIDDYCFAPCGYSANVHTACGAYAVVHVTPQEECSYASFETNFGSRKTPEDQADVSESLNELVGKVLDLFRPAKFTLTLFTDQGAENAIGGAPFESADARYSRRNCTSSHFEQDYVATIVNYVGRKIENKRLRKGDSSDEDCQKKLLPRMLRSRSGLALA